VSWDDVLEGKAQAPGVSETAAAPGPAQGPSDAERAAAAEAQLAQQQQQIEAERQQRQAFTELDQQVRHQRYLLNGAVQEVLAAYPEFRTQQDLQSAWVAGGVRAQRAAEYTRIANALNDKALAAEALEARARDVGQRNNAAVAKAEDDRFLAAHPEYKSKDGVALQKAAVASLKNAGFSEEELARTWDGSQPMYLRDHRVQSFIARQVALENENQALKERLGLAEQSVRRAGRVPANLPPVMRPGTSNLAPTTSIHTQMRSLEHQMAREVGNAGAKLAADLLAAHRVAAKRGY
jgi:hypothetical protein